MEKLTQFEHAILKQAAGLDDEGKGPKQWGAAVGAAGEFLQGMGYLTRRGDLTEKGRAKAHEPYEEK